LYRKEKGFAVWGVKGKGKKKGEGRGKERGEEGMF